MRLSRASFLGGGQFGGDFDTQADTLRRAMTKKGFPKSAADTLAIGPKFWQMYRELGEAVENSNRIAVFKAAQANGKSIAEAVYESKRSEEHTSELQSLMRISYDV